MRLLFAEAGIEYKDVCRDEKSSAAALKFYKGERGPEEFPVLAPPIIRNTETKFVLCQTPAILEYLGRKFHLCPQPENNLELQAQAMQVVIIVVAVTTVSLKSAKGEEKQARVFDTPVIRPLGV